MEKHQDTLLSDTVGENHVTVYIMVISGGLVLIDMAFLMLIPYCFDVYCFVVVSFEVRKYRFYSSYISRLFWLLRVSDDSTCILIFFLNFLFLF